MTLNGTLEDFSPAGILKVLSADGRTRTYVMEGQLFYGSTEDFAAAQKARSVSVRAIRPIAMISPAPTAEASTGEKTPV